MKISLFILFLLFTGCNSAQNYTVEQAKLIVETQSIYESLHTLDNQIIALIDQHRKNPYAKDKKFSSPILSQKLVDLLESLRTNMSILNKTGVTLEEVLPGIKDGYTFDVKCVNY